MHFTTHAAVGAGIGAATALAWPDPVGAAVAFVAGAASHALLDAVPHRDSTTMAEVAADLALGVGLMGWLWVTKNAGGNWLAADGPLLPLLGALGGVLPDLEVALVYTGRMDRRQLRFPSHTGLTPHRVLANGWGLATQLPFLLAGLWLAFMVKPG